MATHALIPRPWRDALNDVAARQGTFPTRLLAESVGALLVRAAAGFTPNTPPLERGSLVALVTRIPPEQVKALHALAARTHIRYSEWLRQAVVDVLREHGAMPGEASEPTRCGCGFKLLPGETAPCVDCRETEPETTATGAMT